MAQAFASQAELQTSIVGPGRARHFLLSSPGSIDLVPGTGSREQWCHLIRCGASDLNAFLVTRHAVHPRLIVNAIRQASAAPRTTRSLRYRECRPSAPIAADNPHRVACGYDSDIHPSFDWYDSHTCPYRHRARSDQPRKNRLFQIRPTKRISRLSTQVRLSSCQSPKLLDTRAPCSLQSCGLRHRLALNLPERFAAIRTSPILLFESPINQRSLPISWGLGLSRACRPNAARRPVSLRESQSAVAIS